jgi:anaerobic magnesium-protoporphyrin IX monomethyl ester cyclase
MILHSGREAVDPPGKKGINDMEKVLFIIPPYSDYDGFVNPAFNDSRMVKKSGEYKRLVTDMPIGLLSLSSYIKKHTDTEVRLLDFNILLNEMESFEYSSFSDLFQTVFSGKEWLDFDPGIIGISALFTSTYYNTLDMAKVLRRIFPKALLIAGGAVPTCMYNEIFAESSDFDALCYGEAEKPMVALLQAKSKGEDIRRFLEAHSSWITRKKAGEGTQLQHDFIENLDEIPFYDYDLLNISKANMSPSLNSFTDFSDTKNVFFMATTRGCPFRCCFCASHSVHGWKMRYHSSERVKEDLIRLSRDYSADTIFFQDDHIMADKQRVLRILEIIRELGLKVLFQNGLAIYALDRTVLETIKKAGINHIVLSVESGSERVLQKIMHKPLDLSMVRRVTADCRELQIDTDINILIGLPGETKEDIEETRAFLKTLYPSWFRIYTAAPLVGSEMYNICLKNNYLKGSHIGSGWKKSVIETPDFTPEFVQEKVYFLNLELNFVFNSDFRLGNYEKALKAFAHVIRIKSDHALAYYFSALCYKALNRDEEYSQFKKTYNEIVNESAFWRNYVEQFKLEPLP